MPCAIAVSFSSEVRIAPSGTAPAGVVVDNRNSDVLYLSSDDVASQNTMSTDC